MYIFNIFKRHYPTAPSEPIQIGSEGINCFEVNSPIIKKHNFSLKMNSKLSFIGKVHVSVGFWFKEEFDDKYFELKCLKHGRPNCVPGGDDYMKTFIFTPIKKGNTCIVINHIFRNRIFKTEIINIQIL